MEPIVVLRAFKNQNSAATYDRIFCPHSFVYEERDETNAAQNEGNQHACGSPRKFDPTPSESNDESRCARTNEHVTSANPIMSALLMRKVRWCVYVRPVHFSKLLLDSARRCWESEEQ